MASFHFLSWIWNEEPTLKHPFVYLSLFVCGKRTDATAFSASSHFYEMWLRNERKKPHHHSRASHYPSSLSQHLQPTSIQVKRCENINTKTFFCIDAHDKRIPSERLTRTLRKWLLSSLTSHRSSGFFLHLTLHNSKEMFQERQLTGFGSARFYAFYLVSYADDDDATWIEMGT